MAYPENWFLHSDILTTGLSIFHCREIRNNYGLATVVDFSRNAGVTTWNCYLGSWKSHFMSEIELFTGNRDTSLPHRILISMTLCHITSFHAFLSSPCQNEKENDYPISFLLTIENEYFQPKLHQKVVFWEKNVSYKLVPWQIWLSSLVNKDDVAGNGTKIGILWGLWWCHQHSFSIGLFQLFPRF